MTPPATPRRWGLHAGLLALWFLASFGLVFFARDLQWVVAGWPIDYWFAAQGAVVVFIAIVLVYARAMSYFEQRDAKAVAHRSDHA